MTGEQQQDIGERMKRLEEQQKGMAADIAEIKMALLGTYEGRGGIARRIERNEDRINIIEAWRVKHEEEAARLVELYDKRVEAAEYQLTEWRAQMKVLAWAAGGGGLAGTVALASRLLEIFAQ